MSNSGIAIGRIYDERFMVRYRDPAYALTLTPRQRCNLLTGQWTNFRMGYNTDPNLEIVDLTPDQPQPDYMELRAERLRKKRECERAARAARAAKPAPERVELPGQLDLATLFDGLREPDPDSRRTPEQNREFHKIIGEIAKANDLPFDSIKALMVEKFFGHPQKTSELTYKDMQALIEWSYKVKEATGKAHG